MHGLKLYLILLPFSVWKSFLCSNSFGIPQSPCCLWTNTPVPDYLSSFSHGAVSLCEDPCCLSMVRNGVVTCNSLRMCLHYRISQRVETAVECRDTDSSILSRQMEDVEGFSSYRLLTEADVSWKLVAIQIVGNIRLGPTARLPLWCGRQHFIAEKIMILIRSSDYFLRTDS